MPEAVERRRDDGSAARARSEEERKEGLALARDGRFDQAIESLARALEFWPDNCAAIGRLAALQLKVFGRPGEATTLYTRLLRHDRARQVPSAYTGLAQALLRFTPPDDVLARVRTLVQPAPVQLRPMVQGTLDALLLDGHYAAALRLADALLAANPDDPVGLIARGDALSERDHDLEGAEACFRRAVARGPGDLYANLQLVLCLHRRGDAAEARAQARRLLSEPSLRAQWPSIRGVPPWDLSAPGGRTFLVHASGGFGDGFQFVRCGSALAAAGARVILSCPASAAALMCTVPGIERVIANLEDAPEADWTLDGVTMFLACLCLDESPSHGTSPYIRPERGPAAGRRPLDAAPDRLIVGVVWSSGMLNDRNPYRFRSMRLTDLRPILDTPGVAARGLQCGPARSEIRAGGLQHLVTDLAGRFRTFSDTADALGEVDVVVTVDTAVAHLAGAMGVRTWILLPYTPAHRWGVDRTDCAWYPTARLFRQRVPGDWREPVQSAREAIGALLASGR